jgi:hypothetical protein|tara:strand:+ start:263 stop:535 length:273 start_codon:yes stop_codon:yes gene_type:complete
MSDDNQKKKDEFHMPYRFISHDYKMAYVLRRIEDLEREHFGLMIDRLDENHQEYENWYRAVKEVMEEMNRMIFIYGQLGGSFDSEIPGVG